MWFLMRTGFWLSAVLLVLPLGGGSKDGDAANIGLYEAYFAARSAAEDLKSFCDRRVETCETGRKLASAVAFRAGEAARIAGNYFGDEPVDSGKAVLSTQNEAVLQTGSVPKN
jgi:Family of unknown function (DUF5330)